LDLTGQGGDAVQARVKVLRASAPANKKNGRCRLHGGASTGPRTAEGRARIAAAQFKHGQRSKKAIAKRKAATRKKKVMYAELKALEGICIESGLLKKDWESAFRFF